MIGESSQVTACTGSSVLRLVKEAPKRMHRQQIGCDHQILQNGSAQSAKTQKSDELQCVRSIKRSVLSKINCTARIVPAPFK
jgi:hypothetical protein